MTHWRTPRCRSGSDLLSPTGLHGYKLQATHILEGRLPCSKEISIALVLETGEYLPDDIAGFEIRNKGLVRIACEQVFCRQIHIEKEGRIEALENALKSRKPDEPGQVERIVRELFEKAQRSWLAVKLVERSALDWPELASLWFGRYRRQVIEQLAEYFDRRMSRRLLRPSPDPKATARLVIELVAYFAIHRQTDPYPTVIDNVTAESLVVDAVVNAYGKRKPKKRKTT